MSNTTPDAAAPKPESTADAADTGATDTATTASDADVANPPSSPVSARGHVNHPEGDEAKPAATAPAATAAAEPAPAIEPEPVVSTDDDIAAAVARSNAAEAPAAAAGSATIDTASPAQAAAPVTIAGAAAARADAAGSTGAYTAPVSSAGEATWAPEQGTTGQQPVYAQPVAPIYVQRPEPPKKKSNRGFGILIALVGTIVFAVLWGAVVALVGGMLTPGREFVDLFLRFLVSYSAWAPVVVFFVGMVLLIQVINRARWWAYILGGLVVAALVYFSYVGAALLDQGPSSLTAEEAAIFIGRQWLNPFAVLAAVIAREVSVWTGAWLAARSRKLKVRNAEARADYDQQVADAQNQAVAAYASPQQSGY
ncbi:hypothetical protein ACFVWR_08825 [Leifsonia sp. NPDC058292]|uniref:hypothetical protein n=1 Tax=Leifsonia sp. NPDC058292 TaxID=3346428 RepID=UPI0036D7B773